MEPFIMYILKVCLAVSLLFIVYLLALQQEKFFRLNRFILLITVTLPFFLPLLPEIHNSPVSQFQRGIMAFRPFDHSYPEPVISNNALPEIALPVSASTPSSTFLSGLSWSGIIKWLYLLITVILLVRFIGQLSNLYVVIRCNKKVMLDNMTCFEHTEALAPFSFLHFLVINRSEYSVEELRQITLHERAHIHQWHTVDILIAEIVHAFLWINPLLPLIKRHIKLNLEFIADESVLTAGIDRKNYQLSIINSALSRSSYPLTNLFNSSKLKRRITMMNANQSPMRHLYKYLFMLPMVAVAYFIVNPVMAGHPMKNRADYNLQDLKAFEGYYQFEQDKDNYIQIFSKNGHLKLKQLWDNKEIPFEQKSDLEFNNREHSFSIVFSKDSKGAITSLLAFGRDVWNKVESYNPVVKNEIQLPAEQVRVFEGMYKLKGNRSDLFLQFIAHGNQLIAKEMWTGKEIVTLPESSMQFFGKDIRYPVTFIKDSKGKVTTAIVFNKDTWEKVEHYRPKKEITLSSQALKAFEGKYRFQFEKDKYSFIQVDVEGNGLLMKELWEEKEFHFVPESDLAFFSPDRYLTVKFTKDEHGKIIHALVFNKDLWEKMD